jgi:protein SCO1/2
VKPFLRSFIVATVLAVLFVVAACTQKNAPSFESADITGADWGRELSLTAHDGNPRTLKDFNGKVVLVFFGFVHCPDVCPTTMVKYQSVLKAIGPDADKVQVLLVTVDPERDTAEVLKPYVTGFNPTFLGLTGSADDIARTAKEFKVIYQKQPGKTPNTYTVDHSSGTYVFDQKGRLRLFAAGSQDAKALEHDVRLLLSGA